MNKNCKVAFLGSSVTYGYRTGGFSFVEAVSELLPCEVDKEAVSGTTLCDDGPTSYVERMERHFPLTENIDYFVIQLSTNDVSKKMPMGTISSSFDRNDFDRKTVLGSMEYIISYIREYFHCGITFYTNPPYDNPEYEAFITRLYELQRKWDFHILDFYHYHGMEPLSQNVLSSYMADPIHPNREGYQWMGEVFKRHLGKLLISETGDC